MIKIEKIFYKIWLGSNLSMLKSNGQLKLLFS